jgi:putative membrane protein
MRIFWRWAIGIVAILVTVKIMTVLPAAYQVMWKDNIWGVVIFVPLFAVVNAILGTFLRLVSLPINCLTFGLFGFVINAIVFLVAGRATGAMNGLNHPIGFVASMLGSIIYTVISTPLSAALGEG